MTKEAHARNSSGDLPVIAVVATLSPRVAVNNISLSNNYPRTRNRRTSSFTSDLNQELSKGLTQASGGASR